MDAWEQRIVGPSRREGVSQFLGDRESGAAVMLMVTTIGTGLSVLGRSVWIRIWVDSESITSLPGVFSCYFIELHIFLFYLSHLVLC